MTESVTRATMISTSGHHVKTGLDVLVDECFERCRGAALGVLANQCAVDSRGVHLISHLQGLNLGPKLVLSPEHGLWSTHQDMEAVHETADPVFGCTVASLYGDCEESLAPARELLSGIDILLADMQDVGARYYTYAATLSKTLRVAAATGTRVIVLDRPNPVNGVDLEGGILLDSMRSYVGELPIPNRHGLTLGELTRLAAGTMESEPPLEVIPMEGWQRSAFYDDTGLLWVPPSPNMPTVATAVVYPGLCLLEGTNVSEGRGTTTPFELFGAPWVRPAQLAARIAAEVPADSYVVTPTCFRPQFGKWAGKLCNGLRLHVTDRRSFNSFGLGLALIKWLRLLHPEDFDWHREEYEFVTDRLAIDLLIGDDAARRHLENGNPVVDVLRMLEESARDFGEARKRAMLYGQP